MKNFTLYNSSRNNLDRKNKRWLGWLSFCIMLFTGQMSFSQCLGTWQLLEFTSDNSGNVQTLEFGWTAAYNEVNGLIVGGDYVFTAVDGQGTGVYITITDTSDIAISHGWSPLMIEGISESIIR